MLRQEQNVGRKKYKKEICAVGAIPDRYDIKAANVLHLRRKAMLQLLFLPTFYPDGVIPAQIELFPVKRILQGLNIQLNHFHHGLHGAGCFCAIFIRQ